MSASNGRRSLARCRSCGRTFDPETHHVRIPGITGLFDRASCALVQREALDEDGRGRSSRPGVAGSIRLLEGQRGG